MRKLSIIFFLFICNSGFSQDPLFINSNQSLVYLNPSYAGTNGFIRNQFLFRDQWPSLSANYKTLYNSFDAYIKPIHGGLAFSYTHDDQVSALVTVDAFNLTYSQHFSFCGKRLKIIPSIQAGYFVKQLNRAKLNFGDVIDPRCSSLWNMYQVIPNSTKSNFDFSGGLLMSYNHFYFGASIFHFNQPDEGLVGVCKLPYRLNIHGAYNLIIKEKTIIHFFAGYQKQNDFSFLQLGLDAVLFKSFIAGCKYFNQDAVAANFGYRNNYFTLQTGYDVTISKLAGNTAGSWEFSASINIRNKDLRKTLTDIESW